MRGDRLGALVILLVALAYVYGAFTFEGAAVADVVGPRAYPVLVGSLVALLAFLRLLRPQLPADQGGSFITLHGRPMVLASGILLYVLALDLLGFALATAVFLSLGHVWLGERSWVRSAALGIALAIVLWYVFNHIFKLNLPAGLLRNLR